VFIFNPIPLINFKDGFPRKNVTYEESIKYHEITINVIQELGYNPIVVEFDNIENRFNMIKNIYEEYL
jgi:predicted ATPase